MDNEEVADNILVEVENLDNQQRLVLHEVIQKLKRESEAERIVQHMKWFDEAILPVLKEFAQNSFTNLEVQRDSDCVSIDLRLPEICRLTQEGAARLP